jgi:hypothetical protein
MLARKSFERDILNTIDNFKVEERQPDTSDRQRTPTLNWKLRSFVSTSYPIVFNLIPKPYSIYFEEYC